ncbi:MAG: TdeIII family type II restriction endonuclease, partial [Thermoproteota archaeon]
AIYLLKYQDANVYSYIAIPYNPYEPKPYERWTLKGMLDLDNELKVAEDFWDFLGGKESYEELLNCFERVGIELRPEIDEYFSRFK